MSKLMDLMQELCPNCVETKTIGDICEICRGKVISKDFINENKGDYPVYSSQTENNGELGKISTFAFDGEYLSWTTDGANAGTVFYRNGKFNITNVCGLLKVRKRDLLIKYLYYVLNAEAPKYVNKGMGNPKLMSNVMAKITIPIPPLPIQEEIVRILDDFTDLTAKITAEITAESTARNKQYEYYREKILSQTNNAEQCALQDIVADSCSISYGIVQTGDDVENGIPVVRPVDLADKIVSLKGLKRVAPSIAESYKRTILKGGDLLLCVRGTTGVISIASDELKGCNVSRGIVPLTFKSTVCPQYIYYQFLSQGIQKEIESKTRGAALKQINMEDLRQIRFPVPTLEVQQQIVSILDRFDFLCNDITSGLPAEIKARQKQYEYYRDKLLSFKE